SLESSRAQEPIGDVTTLVAAGELRGEVPDAQVSAGVGDLHTTRRAVEATGPSDVHPGAVQGHHGRVTSQCQVLRDKLHTDADPVLEFGAVLCRLLQLGLLREEDAGH